MLKISKNLAAIVFLSLLVSRAWADGVANPPAPIDLSPYAKRSDLSDVQSLIMSSIPLPSDAEPKGDSAAGSIGSAIRYLRADSIRPSQSRSILVTLDVNGTASGTWKTPLRSATPVPGAVSAINANSATAQINCNFTALTQNDFAIKCTQQLLSPSVSGLVTSSLNSPAAAGTQVGITAMEPSP